MLAEPAFGARLGSVQTTGRAPVATRVAWRADQFLIGIIFAEGPTLFKDFLS